MNVRAAFFQIDGVLVDMTKFHFFAWRRLADELAIPFTEADNARMRGAGSLRSIEMLLENGGLNLSLAEKEALCQRKLGWLIEYLQRSGPADLMTGSLEFVRGLKTHGIPTVAMVGREETAIVLRRLDVGDAFDAALTEHEGIHFHPESSDYRLAARRFNAEPQDCLAFESTVAGVEAARAAGATVVAVGSPERLPGAHRVIPGLWACQPHQWAAKREEAFAR